MTVESFRRNKNRENKIIKSKQRIILKLFAAQTSNGVKIVVRAKPSSKVDKLEKISDAEFSVHIKEPPVGGRANAAIIKLLAEYFHVNQSQIEIISGLWSRVKVIEINQ